MLAVATTIVATPSQSHSPMFADYFEYDASQGGESVSMQLRQRMQGSGVTRARVNCIDQVAAGFPCWRIDLQSFMAKSQLGGTGTNLNDIWGWTDPLTGAEIAIIGLENGTSFVDVTDPVAPVYLGKLDTHEPRPGANFWRDIKVYNDHAFIVADGQGNHLHGLQIFDLNQLRNIVTPPVQLTETAHVNSFGSAHNIAINEDSGYAYVVGSDKCAGGLFMINIANPGAPRHAGCYPADGYTHDAQCVIYQGPDGRYSGREICFAYNEDAITIVDVTDKRNPRQLSTTDYQNRQYTHQGWILDIDQSLIVMNDELDEVQTNDNTRSYVFDVSNLRRPELVATYTGSTQAIDHNLYTRDGYVFQSNYRAGFRILSAQNIHLGRLREVAWFDVIPNSNSAQFSGAWSSYIYFASGNIVVSDIGGGLFVLAPRWPAIRGDSLPVEISVDSVVVDESATLAEVSVHLSRISGTTVSVNAVTRSRSAKPGSDYLDRMRRIRFLPGQTRQTMTGYRNPLRHSQSDSMARLTDRSVGMVSSVSVTTTDSRRRRQSRSNRLYEPQY